MRNHRERKRTITLWTKQHHMRGMAGIRRRHQPLLHAVWFALDALRAEALLRRAGCRDEHGQDGGCEKHFSLTHEFGLTQPKGWDAK
jgi:hypothetical protein